LCEQYTMEKNNGEGQKNGGQWKKDKEMRDKELEDNGEWGQRNNGGKGTMDMGQWRQKEIIGYKNPTCDKKPHNNCLV